jgi:hypothetical protein
MSRQNGFTAEPGTSNPKEPNLKRSRKLLFAAGIMGGVLALSGVALALWTSTGSGSGRAQSLSAVGVTVTATTGTADLYPGFANGDAYFTLTNTNPYPIRFTSMTSGTVTSSDTTACPSSNVTVDGSASGLTLDVAANSTSAPLSIADVVNMDVAAPDGCQGKTFNIALTLTGSQT